MDACKVTSQKLLQCLEALKPKRNRPPLGSMDERVAALEKRFIGKIEKNECWQWIGSTDGGGYGGFTIGPKQFRAHRISWMIYQGDIPEGLDLDHLCRNRLCVNPKHLEPVTKRENALRSEGVTALNARKTHCYRGHEFNHENTRLETSGSRGCRTCARDEGRRKNGTVNFRGPYKIKETSRGS